MTEYKLYVWEFCPDWYPGVIVAHARTVKEARELILNEDNLKSVGDAIRGKPKIYKSGHAIVNWGGG